MGWQHFNSQLLKQLWVHNEKKLLEEILFSEKKGTYVSRALCNNHDLYERLKHWCLFACLTRKQKSSWKIFGMLVYGMWLTWTLLLGDAFGQKEKTTVLHMYGCCTKGSVGMR